MKWFARSAGPAGSTVSQSRRSLIEWLYVGVILLAFGGYLSYSLYDDRAHIDARERERLAHQGNIVAESVSRQLNVINMAMTGILKELPGWRQQKDGARFAARHLKTLNDAMPGVRTLLILDREGTVESSDKAELVGRNFAQREYFQTVLHDPKPGTLYLSSPFRTALGHFTMNLMRIVAGADGKFDGVVIAAMDSDEFSILLNSMVYQPDVRASLIHGDGTLYLTAPPSNNVEVLELLRPGSFFTQHLASGKQTGVFAGVVGTIAEEHIVVFQNIQPPALSMDKPLVIAVERGQDSTFAHWHKEVLKNCKLFAVVTLLAVAALLLHQRRWRNVARTEAAYEAERQRSIEALRQSEERFRSLTALSSDWYWEQDDQFRFVRLQGDLDQRTHDVNEAHIGKTRWEMGADNLTDADWESHRAALAAHEGFRDLQMQRCDKEGKRHWSSISGMPIFDTQGNFLGYRGIARDITAQKLAESEIKHLAFYDNLTQLPNRRLLNDRLAHAFAASKRSGHYGALMFLDLDNFKPLNDSYGHEAGDLLLIEVAGRITKCLRQVDTVARFGGDEFAVILSELDADAEASRSQAGVVAEKIRAILAEPYLLTLSYAEGIEHSVTHKCSVSIGIALFLDHQAGRDQVFKQADLAMYRAKEAGRNLIRFHVANV